jgi:hypothetical protein
MPSIIYLASDDFGSQHKKQTKVNGPWGLLIFFIGLGK